MDLSPVIKRLKSRAHLFLAFASFFVVWLVWEMASLFGAFGPQVFPAPMDLARSFGELTANGTLLKHSVASLYRVTVGFYLAAIVGIPMGILIGRLQLMRHLVDPPHPVFAANFSPRVDTAGDALVRDR